MIVCCLATQFGFRAHNAIQKEGRDHSRQYSVGGDHLFCYGRSGGTIFEGETIHGVTGHNTARKAKKPLHGSHSVSVNCNETSANYSGTFAYFRITNNTLAHLLYVRRYGFAK